jgi:hypothetical protein
MGLAETDIKVQAEPATNRANARDIYVTLFNGGFRGVRLHHRSVTVLVTRYSVVQIRGYEVYDYA